MRSPPDRRRLFEEDLVAGPRWVTEWQYAAVRDVLLARADLLVRPDLPRHLVMARVVRRTVHRRLHREELWSGNVEPRLRTFLTGRDHIVRWPRRSHPRTRERVTAVLTTRPELVVARPTTPAEGSAWVDGPLRARAYC